MDKETCINDNRPARYELFTTIPGRTEGVLSLGPTADREVRQVVCKRCYDREAQGVAGFFFVHTINDMKAK